MILNPLVGDRIVTGDVCRVVTRVHPRGAIEYDLLRIFPRRDGNALPGMPGHKPPNWQKIEERICCYDMWQHYAEQDGRLL